MFGYLKGSPPESLSGGYEYEFIDPVPDRLICSICTQVLREPHLVVCCGQKYCQSCLQKWLKTRPSESCPHCQASEKFFQHVLEKGLKREIESLKVKCSNHDRGCEWTGEIGNMSDHLHASFRGWHFRRRDTGCDYAEISCHCYWKGEKRLYKEHLDKDCLETLVQCPYKCQGGNTKVLRKNLSKHLKDRCESKDHTCPRCYSFTWYITQAHDDVCPKFPVTCPNICGEEGLVRESLESHLLECKYGVVSCKYCHLGCLEKVRCQDMPQHLISHQSQHLEMIEKDYEKLKEELSEVKTELADKAEIVRHELKLAGEKYTLGWPLQFIDSISSLTSQFRDNQSGTETELAFRMLSFQEIKESKFVWHSPKFPLLGHGIQLLVRGCDHSHALQMELWNCIPKSCLNSSTSLRVIVQVRKPSFKKIKFLSFSPPNASSSPQIIPSKVSISPKLSFPSTKRVDSPSSLASGVGLSLPGASAKHGSSVFKHMFTSTSTTGHDGDSKCTRGVCSTEKNKSPSKPNVINWDNPILAKPVLSTSIEVTTKLTTCGELLPTMTSSNAALEFDQTSVLRSQATCSLPSVAHQQANIPITPSVAGSQLEPASEEFFDAVAAPESMSTIPTSSVVSLISSGHFCSNASSSSSSVSSYTPSGFFGIKTSTVSSVEPLIKAGLFGGSSTPLSSQLVSSSTSSGLFGIKTFTSSSGNSSTSSGIIGSNISSNSQSSIPSGLLGTETLTSSSGNSLISSGIFGSSTPSDSRPSISSRLLDSSNSSSRGSRSSSVLSAGVICSSTPSNLQSNTSSGLFGYKTLTSSSGSSSVSSGIFGSGALLNSQSSLSGGLLCTKTLSHSSGISSNSSGVFGLTTPSSSQLITTPISSSLYGQSSSHPRSSSYALRGLFPSSASTNSFDWPAEGKISPNLQPQNGPFYFDFQPVLISEELIAREAGSLHLLCSWVVNITKEWEETYVENNSVLWHICIAECQN